MKEKLKILFDYQKFQRNPRLESLIQNVKSGAAVVLSDEELFYVSAAGAPLAAERNTFERCETGKRPDDLGDGAKKLTDCFRTELGTQTSFPENGVLEPTPPVLPWKPPQTIVSEDGVLKLTTK